MRYGGAGKRRDTSEPEIIAALQAVGAIVKQISGDGLPDLLVCWRGRWLPIEVKSKGGRVRDKQRIYPIARTAAEALALFGVRT